jgi:hypothetical protein
LVVGWAHCGEDLASTGPLISPAQASVGLGGYSVINAGTLLLDLNAADYDG